MTPLQEPEPWLTVRVAGSGAPSAARLPVVLSARLSVSDATGQVHTRQDQEQKGGVVRALSGWGGGWVVLKTRGKGVQDTMVSLRLPGLVGFTGLLCLACSTPFRACL